jgi:hypothetical protein
MVLAGRQSKIGHALHVQLVGGVAQVVGLEELHLVGDAAGAELLVGRVLQVPAGLGLLHVLADHCALSGLGLGLVGQRLPDLEVLVGVAGLVLGWQLPCDDVGAQRGEAELEDVDGGDGRDEVAGRGVDDRNPGIVSQTNLHKQYSGEGLTVRATPRQSTCCRASSICNEGCPRAWRLNQRCPLTTTCTQALKHSKHHCSQCTHGVNPGRGS